MTRYSLAATIAGMGRNNDHDQPRVSVATLGKRFCRVYAIIAFVTSPVWVWGLILTLRGALTLPELSIAFAGGIIGLFALLGFLHEKDTFGRLAAPYLLCGSLSMAAALVIDWVAEALIRAG